MPRAVACRSNDRADVAASLSPPGRRSHPLAKAGTRQVNQQKGRIPMNASQEGNALTIDGERRVPLAFPDEKAEQRLRARLRTGQAMSVRIAPTDPSDVQGHSLDL